MIKNDWKYVDQIRVRIMQEAYDCADRGETDAYNSVKVMCSDVLEMVGELLKAEREACAKVCENIDEPLDASAVGTACAAAIRARGQT